VARFILPQVFEAGHCPAAKTMSQRCRRQIAAKERTDGSSEEEDFQVAP
jgi:hypothetical protein